MQKEIRFYDLNDSDYLKELNSLVKLLRSPEDYGSLDFKSSLTSVTRAEREISSAIRHSISVSEHEKWLYENGYILRRVAEKFSDKTIMLPSKGEEPRIVSILRFWLYHKSTLKKEDLLFTLEAAQKETFLTLQEIKSIPSALCYVLAEGISIVAERILYHNQMRRRAERDPLDSDYFTSDIYNYYLLRKSGEKEKIRNELLARGVNIKGADAAFTISIMENDELAKKFFTLLQVAEDFVPLYETVATTEIYKILSRQKCYKKMSFDTELYYLEFVGNLAKITKKSEIFVAKQLIEFSIETNSEIGDTIFHNKCGFKTYLKTKRVVSCRTPRGGKELAYFCATLSLASLVTVSIAILTQSFFALFLFLPLMVLSEAVINRLLRKAIKRRFLPRMNYREVPPSAKTLVVVSEYIASKEQLVDAVRRLRVLKAGNSGGAVEFSLLIDFKASTEEEDVSDLELIEYLKLHLKDIGLQAFVRKRVKISDKFMGRERKRGAIEELNSMLASGVQDAFRFVLKSLEKPEFVVLLDADNTVEPGGILEMVNLIAHPANAKYDLLSASGRYRLESPKTAYSKRFYREGGLEHYPHYSSFFFDMFEKDIFCGKGIFRLKSYEKKLSGIFPEKKILSHDILEGAILNTASGGVVYEEAPETFLQEEERVTRWQRGDIQLLPFLFGCWKNKEGQKYRSEIPLFYRVFMLRNAFAVLSPCSLFVALVLGLFTSPILAISAILVSMFPFFIDFVSNIQSIAEKRRVRYAVRGICRSLVKALEEFFLLPYRAVKNLTIFIGTIRKMAMKKNLLIWKTYYLSKKDESATTVFKMSALPLLVLTIVLIPIFFFAQWATIPLALYAVIMLSTISVLCRMSQQKCKKPLQSESFLKDVSDKICKYFDAMRTSGLPSDNYQERPYLGRSKTTSATNLGFVAVSDVCAFYLGYRDKEDTVRYLVELIKKFIKLKKWKGNLYNWYDLIGNPIQTFVSSVDSGNFLACLMVVKGFLTEVGETEVLPELNKLIEETDLSALYDKEKKLLHLGYDTKTKKFCGHYDMLMSESRLTAYLCAARGADTAIWRALGRDYTAQKGNTLLSWSGTMFEYLMTTLFLNAPDGSLVADSEMRAVSVQKSSRYFGVWGRSESGYYKFDEDSNYQYHAIGDENLSLRSETSLPVVAPYSAALALLKRPSAAIKNMKRLKKLGLLGEYGFYESVDFSSGKKNIVESYMTHHQGMTLAALTNYLKGNILVKLFEKSEVIASATLLLTEKTSEKAVIKKQGKMPQIVAKKQLEYYEISTNIEYSSKIFALLGGKASIFSDNLGNNQTRFGRVIVSRPFSSGGAPRGAFFYAEGGKNVFHSATVAPQLNPYGEYESGQTENKIFFKNIGAKLMLEIRKNDNFNAVTKRFTVDVPTGKQVKVAFIDELALNEKDAFLSHPTFNGMFVETSYLAEKKTIIAQKRASDTRDDKFFAFVIKGMDKLFIETDRAKLVGRGRTLANPLILEEFKEDGVPDVGDVLEPAFGFSGLTELSKDGKAIVEVTMFTAQTMEELNRILDCAPREFFRYAEKSVSENAFADRFIAQFVTNLMLKPRGNADIFKSDGGDEKLFREYNRGGQGILFRVGQSLNSLRKLIKAIKCAESIGITVFLNLYLLKAPDERVIKAVEELTAKQFLKSYRIISESEVFNAAKYCFLELCDDLILPKLPDYESKLRKLRISSESPIKLTEENYVLPGECGGFLENGNFLLTNKPNLPFSNIVAQPHGGFVATENGGGFAFFGNSRENKQNEFLNDPICDFPTEFIFFGEKSFVRINKGASATKYSPGKITYYSHYHSLTARVEEYLIEDGKLRIFELELASKDTNPSLYYGFKPSLDWKRTASDVIFSADNGALKVKNLKNGNTVFVRIFADTLKSHSVSGCMERYPWIKSDFEGSDHKIFIVISEKDIAANLKTEDILSKKEANNTQTAKLSPFFLKSKDKSTDLLFNYWLMPQIYFSRLNARTGYYQVGGAIGFRDQLQDVIALLSTDSERAKNQILIAARHQYVEGDVQHWWHPPKFGIRTRISDDKLFLPLVTAKYLRSTGDKSILEEEVPYLISAVLKPSELSRLENPHESKETESLLKHCMKAFKNALKYGEHGLLILGTGDWNDGIDDAGKHLRGESVVTSLIFLWAVKEFSDYIQDSNIRLELLSIAEKLKESIKKHAYKNGRFLRLYSDDGKWYGTGEGALKVDLVSESLAVLSGVANEEEARSALDVAESLVDKENKIIKLLSPPLTEKTHLGYLSKYPKGVRENGGQYTHATIWYLMALVKIGDVEKAYEYFKMINPVEKYADSKVYEKYKGEPFVLSGDVYSSSRNMGRMGWSWYTGSAAWCYHFLTECILGIKKVGNELQLLPNLPTELNGAELVYRYKNSVYQIKFLKTGARKLSMDGTTLETEGKIPLLQNRRAEIVVEC